MVEQELEEVDSSEVDAEKESKHPDVVEAHLSGVELHQSVIQQEVLTQDMTE